MCDTDEAYQTIDAADAAAGRALRAVAKRSIFEPCQNPGPLFAIVRALIGEEYMESAPKRESVRLEHVPAAGYSSIIAAGDLGVTRAFPLEEHPAANAIKSYELNLRQRQHLGVFTGA